jgi:hypothetical protein
MTEEHVDVDDAVRWLGKQRPTGLVLIGLAILEVSLAIAVCTTAYIHLDKYWAETHPQVDTAALVRELLKDK